MLIFFHSSHSFHKINLRARRYIITHKSKFITAYASATGKSTLLRLAFSLYEVKDAYEARLLVLGDKNMQLWSIAEEKMVLELKCQRDVSDFWVSEAVHLPNGTGTRYALSVSSDLSVRLWALEAGAEKEKAVLIGVHKEEPGKVRFNRAEGTQLSVLTVDDYAACLWRIDTANDFEVTHATYGLLGEAKEDSVGGASLLGEDGDALAVWSKGTGSKCIQFFDAKSGQPVHTAHLAAQCKELVELPPTGEADEVFDAVSVSMQGLSLWRGYQQEGIVVKQVPLRGHSPNVKVAVQVVFCTPSFLSIGGDKAVLCWSRRGEQLWALSFGFNPEKVIADVDPVTGHFRSLFVQMDKGK